MGSLYGESETVRRNPRILGAAGVGDVGDAGEDLRKPIGQYSNDYGPDRAETAVVMG